MDSIFREDDSNLSPALERCSSRGAQRELHGDWQENDLFFCLYTQERETYSFVSAAALSAEGLVALLRGSA